MDTCLNWKIRKLEILNHKKLLIIFIHFFLKFSFQFLILKLLLYIDFIDVCKFAFEFYKFHSNSIKKIAKLLPKRFKR